MTSNVPGSGTGLPVRPVLDKVRIGSFIVLTVLLLMALALAWRTEDAMANRPASRAQPQSPAQNALIEPWQAAVDLGAMAVSAEEQQYARNAEALADHEVHQAFQEALNQAELEVQKRSHQPESQRLEKIVSERQQVVAQDQATLKELTPPAGTAAATGDSINNDLDLANAQLQLDNDALKDAQQALALNLGDERAQLEQALNAHEAAVKKFEADATAKGLSAVATSRHYGTLVRRLTAWFDQNSRLQALQQAADQTQSSIAQINTGKVAKTRCGA